MARPEFAPGAPGAGMLLPRDEALPPVPLERTAFSVDVVGPLAATSLVQQFRSAHTAPLDALYVFPLPADAAVTALVVQIGARVVRGELRARDEAAARFRDAAERGATAALLGQERPNLFSVELANLQPGEPVEVRLEFFARVPYDDGWFTLSLPTVGLPRYTPEDQPAGPRDGVLPLLPADERGHSLGLRVTIDAGRLAEVASPSHELHVVEERGRHVVTLRDGAALPDRDLVLRYRPAGESYASAAFVQRPAGQPGTLLLSLTPRAVPAPGELLPRELLFVFDRSGSMSGESIAQARNALRACLRALNPGDSFNIFPFDNEVEQLAPAPLPFTQASVDAADSFIATIEARGGTEIVGALRAALQQPRDPERMRVVVFLTDGAVGNEAAVIRELAGGLNEARVFAFGVGSAVNRFLIDKLAAVGRGSAEYILPGQPGTEGTARSAIGLAVQRFQRRAAMPLVRDLSVDWGGAPLADVLPDPLPDLYAGQPLVLLAHFHGASHQRVTATVRGRSATGTFEERLTLDLPSATPDRGGAWAALPRLWARARLDALEDAARLEPARAAEHNAEIRRLALEHGLLSAQTSFVAVEEPPPGERRERATARVVVPVHLPAGTRREVFEGPARARATSGVQYGVAAAPASAARGTPRKTGPGMVGGFLQSLRESLAGDEGRSAAPQMRAPAPLGAPMPPAPTSFAGQAMPRPQPTPAERRDAALRFLARTQAVDGSWAGEAEATALALQAFARAGHTASAGDYRAQLGRAQAWLAAQSAPATAADEAAHAALRAAGLTIEQLAAAQAIGGDADGAVLLRGTDALRPTAQIITLTAALVILI